MEYYFSIIVLAIGACGHNYDPGVISASSAETGAEKLADVILDQNTASGNINTNNYYIGDGGPNYYGNKFNYARYFDKDFETLLGRELNDVENHDRTRGNYRYFGYDYGNPDVHSKIERPCQSYDLFCIRKFFAEHSACKISGRQVPDPLYRAQTTVNVPNNNVSVTLINVEYKGIKDGRVEEFFIDKVTNNLVITIDFDAVSFASANVYLKYYLRGREPIVTRDAAGATFLKVSVTVVIPNPKDLKLDRADIFTYASEPIPPFLVGPRLALSTDPEVPLMFAATNSRVPLDAMEVLTTDGNFYAANFIQYNICDFGLKVL